MRPAWKNSPPQRGCGREKVNPHNPICSTAKGTTKRDFALIQPPPVCSVCQEKIEAHDWGWGEEICTPCWTEGTTKIAESLTACDVAIESLEGQITIWEAIANCEAIQGSDKD